MLQMYNQYILQDDYRDGGEKIQDLLPILLVEDDRGNAMISTFLVVQREK